MPEAKQRLAAYSVHTATLSPRLQLLYFNGLTSMQTFKLTHRPQGSRCNQRQTSLHHRTSHRGPFYTLAVTLVQALEVEPAALARGVTRSRKHANPPSFCQNLCKLKKQQRQLAHALKLFAVLCSSASTRILRIGDLPWRNGTSHDGHTGRALKE